MGLFLPRTFGPTQTERQSALFLMAHRSITISDNFTGANNAGWDPTKWSPTVNDPFQAANTVDIQSNSGRILNTTGNYNWSYKDLIMPPKTSFLITCKITPPTGEWYITINTRQSSRRANLHEPHNGYFLEYNHVGLQVARWLDGWRENVASASFFASGAAQLEVTTIGQTITMKAWTDGTGKPTNPQITYIDPTPPLIPGICAVQLYPGAPVATYTALFDDFVVKAA